MCKDKVDLMDKAATYQKHVKAGEFDELFSLMKNDTIQDLIRIKANQTENARTSGHSRRLIDFIEAELLDRKNESINRHNKHSKWSGWITAAAVVGTLILTLYLSF